MFPLLLQSIVSNQMRPQRLRGAWFNRFLQHPARRRSGSILSPGIHMGGGNIEMLNIDCVSYLLILVLKNVLATVFLAKLKLFKLIIPDKV